MKTMIETCCTRKECGGLIITMDREAVAHLLGILDPEFLRNGPLVEEARTQLKEIGKMLAHDIMTAMTNPGNEVIRMSQEDKDALFEKQVPIDAIPIQGKDLGELLQVILGDGDVDAFIDKKKQEIQSRMH